MFDSEFFLLPEGGLMRQYERLLRQYERLLRQYERLLRQYERLLRQGRIKISSSLQAAVDQVWPLASKFLGATVCNLP